MKKLYMILACLLLTNALLLSAQSYYFGFDDEYDDYFDFVEPLSAGCLSGGIGASSCQIDGGIDMGGGVSVGCSVTCNKGYYACCSISGCKCKRQGEGPEVPDLN